VLLLLPGRSRSSSLTLLSRLPRYLLDVEEATPLVDYRGVCGGELLVSMIPKIEGMPEGEVEVSASEANARPKKHAGHRGGASEASAKKVYGGCGSREGLEGAAK
jgi:hypothetical protein